MIWREKLRKNLDWKNREIITKQQCSVFNNFNLTRKITKNYFVKKFGKMKGWKMSPISSTFQSFVGNFSNQLGASKTNWTYLFWRLNSFNYCTSKGNRNFFCSFLFLTFYWPFLCGTALFCVELKPILSWETDDEWGARRLFFDVKTKTCTIPNPKAKLCTIPKN